MIVEEYPAGIELAANLHEGVQFRVEVKPQEFVDLEDEAIEMGFLGVMSGPLVRSSYRAGRLWATAMRKKGWEIPAELTHIESSGSTRQDASSLLAAHP